MKQIICPNCRGIKYFDCYKHVADGVCFTCGGSGVIEIDEENEKIESEKVSKRNKRQTESLLIDLKKKWFNNNDIIYIVNEKNTYNIKEILKEDGAIYNQTFKIWYFAGIKENYNLIQIVWDEVLNDNNIGYATNFRNLIQTKSNKNLKGF